MTNETTPEKKPVNKWVIAGGAILGVLLLGNIINGDDTQPQNTVTVTEEAPAPEPSETQSSSTTSVKDTFIMYMTVAGVPDYMLEGEALDILVDQAQTVCQYISEGDSKQDILWIITVASENSGASEEVTNAFLAASVAATFSYCPQYEGFWD